MKVKVVDSALSGVAYLFRREHEVYFTRWDYNRFGHTLFTPPVTRSDIPSYYVLFKRDFLWSFNKQFESFVKENREFSGVGESVNKKVLFNAVDFLGVDFLVFVYDNGKAYRVSAKAIRSFCQKHNLVRTQDKVNSFKVRDGLGVPIPIRETTYSFPVKLLEYLGDIM